MKGGEGPQLARTGSGGAKEKRQGRVDLGGRGKERKRIHNRLIPQHVQHSKAQHRADKIANTPLFLLFWDRNCSTAWNMESMGGRGGKGEMCVYSLALEFYGLNPFWFLCVCVEVKF